MITSENLHKADESISSPTVLPEETVLWTEPLLGDNSPVAVNADSDEANSDATSDRASGAEQVIEEMPREMPREMSVKMPADEAPLTDEVLSATLHWDPPVILVVDDDPSQRLFVSHIARIEGFKVVEVASAEECLALFAKVQPDIVMLDAVMPGMDGFSCCEQLQQIDQQIPVLIVTALNDQASIDRAFAVGASDYVAKPIHWGVLKQRLQRMVQTKRAMQELRHQSEQERRLIQHIQQLNAVLEQKVQERTAQLNAQVQELQHLDELKNDFICTVSHELRTPCPTSRLQHK
ncbi:MAG: response regulator [Synechococcaceae cyanobacterium RM1_1_27]|nr:response regulator [Synechococcaceae cyanobacterium RM1_1_27]